MISIESYQIQINFDNENDLDMFGNIFNHPVITSLFKTDPEAIRNEVRKMGGWISNKLWDITTAFKNSITEDNKLDKKIIQKVILNNDVIERKFNEIIDWINDHE